ncbi:hypothetical protein [Microvirga sp. P5_D2]
MRALILPTFIVSVLMPAGTFAQEWAALPAPQTRMMQDRDVRWNACYKETRLMYRTRNHSLNNYRAIIKDARYDHMRECMARPQLPRPIARPDADVKQIPSTIAGWAANP